MGGIDGDWNTFTQGNYNPQTPEIVPFFIINYNKPTNSNSKWKIKLTQYDENVPVPKQFDISDCWDANLGFISFKIVVDMNMKGYCQNGISSWKELFNHPVGGFGGFYEEAMNFSIQP